MYPTASPPGKASYDYLPALDGFRAVSILCVVLSHAGNGWEKIFPGMFGVITFFVLSGFLITQQMVAEIEAAGTLNIRGFYIRRAIRLLPALLLYLVVFVPLLLYLGVSVTRLHMVSGLFYFANYYHLFTGYPDHSPFPILWSLSVEEHFYILFPFVMLAFRKQLKSALPAIGYALIAALFWRIALHLLCMDHAAAICGLPGSLRTQGTDAVFDCILYGSFAALLLHYYPEETRRIFINRASFRLAVLLLLSSFAIRTPVFRETLRYSVQSACVAVVMLNVLAGEARVLKRILEHTWMTGIGKLSYSLYLMHFGVLMTIEAAYGMSSPSGISGILLYLFLSFTAAGCTYLLVEAPMADVRRRFSRRVWTSA